MDDTVVINNGKMEYIITWFIENYSWHKEDEILSSPRFTADSLKDTVWFLDLHPGRGKSNIALYLIRNKVDDGPEVLPLKFELSILAADGSTLHSLEFDYAFRKGYSGYKHGKSDFLQFDKERQKSYYLHQDTLSVRCKMWKNEENIMKVGNCTARTRIGFEKISFLHKVENFSYLYPNEKNTLQIPSCSKAGCVISSSLYFTNVWSFEGTVIVEIVPSKINYILRKQKLSLLDRSGNIIECREVDNRFEYSSHDIQKLALSLTRQMILNRKSEYLPNNELSLICECSFSTGVDLTNIEEIQFQLPIASLKQSRSNSFIKNGYIVEEKLSACPSAQDDLKTIYNTQRLTDIEIKTKTKSFPAHKLMLCARSSVFSAMLTNDMKEKNTDCIQVDDLENDIVQQFLRFLYADDLETFQWESAIKLYYAGDKYAVEKLKVLCSSFLVDNISTCTASELLLLADTHNDSDLKKSVEDYILQHEEAVFGSEEWVKLIETNPLLVSKTMCLKYNKKK